MVYILLLCYNDISINMNNTDKLLLEKAYNKVNDSTKVDITEQNTNDYNARMAAARAAVEKQQKRDSTKTLGPNPFDNNTRYPYLPQNKAEEEIRKILDVYVSEFYDNSYQSSDVDKGIKEEDFSELIDDIVDLFQLQHWNDV